MMDFAAKYDEYLNFFNASLEKRLDFLKDDAPKTIKDAMRYAVSGGGKRVRIEQQRRGRRRDGFFADP